MDVIDRLPQTGNKRVAPESAATGQTGRKRQYIERYGEDLPKIPNWKYHASNQKRIVKPAEAGVQYPGPVVSGLRRNDGRELISRSS
jgi:hypothetical protein